MMKAKKRRASPEAECEDKEDKSECEEEKNDEESSAAAASLDML